MTKTSTINKMNITVSEVEVELWNQNLNQFKNSLFLSIEWVLAMSGESNTPIFLNFLDGEEVVGKLSGFICSEGRLKGSQLYCYASPSLKNHDKVLFDACHDALLDFAKKKRLFRIVLGSYDQRHSMECDAKGYFKTRRFEYVVNFDDKNGVHQSKGFKQNMRKAKMFGAVLNKGESPAVLERLFELMEITKKHRVNKYGSEYNPFYLKCMSRESLLRFLETGAGRVYHVDCDAGDIHCVQLNIEMDGRAYGLLMGSDQFAYDNGFPSFVDYHLIDLLNKNEFHYYNPGGGTNDQGNAGIEKYKKSMGAEKVMYGGATTNFLVYPHKILNPLLNIGRMLPSSEKGFVGFLKRLV